MNFNKPNLDEFINLLNKYSRNVRVNSINAIQYLPRKSTLFKLMKTDIPVERMIINNINLNKILKNLIVLTSEHSCPIGDYNEYIRYKGIYDTIESDTSLESNVREEMLKHTREKMIEYSIENEFKNNKSVHNLAKKILIFLSVNSIDSNEFYRDAVIKLKGQTSGVYVAPTINYRENRENNRYPRNNTIYQPPTESTKTGDFIDIHKITQSQSVNIDDKEAFPEVLTVKPSIETKPVTSSWSSIIK